MGRALVFQSDFGLADGAVSAMHGVAFSVSPAIPIFNLTHNIPAFSVWEASCRLYQTLPYWPEGTVFVSVVDPGVGSERRSLAVKTVSGQVVITPDNGTLTHVSMNAGITEARIIDETMNRLPGSLESHTFHGRDIYAYTGARLASGAVSFEELGEAADPAGICVLHAACSSLKKDKAAGGIEIMDVRFGNLWTNIGRSLLKEMSVAYGDKLTAEIRAGQSLAFRGQVTFGKSFADVPGGEPVAYINSLGNLGLAVNQGSFAEIFSIGAGQDWTIAVEKADPGELLQKNFERETAAT
ncbi:SAM hydrolase/SAM-dependent halogenase family protein [Bacillus infantis]|uniref:SAM hydrolase/SAM-dependent halogenase family protein n=1 Tax=Bacillus infantis TaxID=324767 RepID=UPI0021554AFC|nr:S-adenosyl-l-methionine hydroxide adenosyltransferase family protein [Bacillus infantis]MCR6611447.1 S-adenosyl-l-methionine hydroxide adenosyltransferase family protein [Bacillus infantis]